MPNVLFMMVGFPFQGQMEISLNFLVQERAKFTIAFPTIIVHKSGSILETFVM